MTLLSFRRKDAHTGSLFRHLRVEFVVRSVVFEVVLVVLAHLLLSCGPLSMRLPLLLDCHWLTVQVEDRLPFRLQTPSDEALSFAIVLDHVPPQMSQQEDL
jgi:hypothetical protein